MKSANGLLAVGGREEMYALGEAWELLNHSEGRI